MTIEILENLGNRIDEVFILIGLAILLIEIAEALFKGEMRGKKITEALISISTQIPFLVVETFILAGAYGVFYILSELFVTWTLPLNGWTIAAAVIVADLTYYWEHRTSHFVRLLWTQHAVHHSSRDLNIVTSVRFGPFEGVWSLITHIPMVFLGFSPELIFFGILTVLAYQTWIHTEVIGRMGPLERVLNTPSHHRVHHASDAKYLDKNFGGILIIWDRMFGSFKEEEETPKYGLTHDLGTNNPVKVWFSEIPGLWQDLKGARTFGEAWMYVFGRPGWRPRNPT